MRFKDIIPVSCYASIATVTNESMEKVKFFIQYNKSVIEQFPNIVIALNRLDNVSDDMFDRYANEWRRTFKNVTIIERPNLGHMRGTIDLEESILKVVKEMLPNVKYLWKSMEDVILPVDILDRETEEVDFYYLPGFSTESIKEYVDANAVINNFEDYLLTPQSTFFILNISNVDTLYGTDVEKKWISYDAMKDRYPGLKPWEIPFDIKFDCETHLGRTVENLSKKCLLNLETYKSLINFAFINDIGDPSHKNFMLDGFCHFHYWQKEILEF